MSHPRAILKVLKKCGLKPSGWSPANRRFHGGPGGGAALRQEPSGKVDSPGGPDGSWMGCGQCSDACARRCDDGWPVGAVRVGVALLGARLMCVPQLFRPLLPDGDSSVDLEEEVVCAASVGGSESGGIHMTAGTPGEGERLSFSLRGVNIHDDDALEAFALRVWQAANEDREGTMNDKPGPSTVLTDKYTAALAYATALHGASVRKGTTVTYMCHLIGVSSLVLEAGGTEAQAIAGLLHDAVEDAGGMARASDIRVRFGDEVADIVLACSDSVDEEWKETVSYCERKQKYLDHLEHDASVAALLVSIADKVHNARATVTDVHRYGVEVLDKFNAPARRSVVWYHVELLRIAQARGTPEALVVPLGLAVADLQSQVPGPWACT